MKALSLRLSPLTGKVTEKPDQHAAELGSTEQHEVLEMCAGLAQFCGFPGTA
jgi:hypothetical protein